MKLQCLCIYKTIMSDINFFYLRESRELDTINYLKKIAFFK